MEQPAPATAQNTNVDEYDEVLFGEDDEDESTTLTLAPIDRRVDTSIDVDAKCLGPARWMQGVKAAEVLGALKGLPLEGLPLDTPDDELQTLKAQILELRRKNVDTAAHPYLHFLALKGVGASARDAAGSDKVRYASLKHYKQMKITSFELRDAERNFKRIADATKRDAALLKLKSWDAKHQQREEKAMEELRKIRRERNMGWLRQQDPARYREFLGERVKTLQEIVHTGRFPPPYTIFMEVEAGGVFLQSWVQTNSINVNGGIHKCNVLDVLFEGDGKLGKQLAALSDPKLYKKLRMNYLSDGLGYSAAKTIQRLALTCKQYPDMTPIKHLLTNLEEVDTVTQTYKLFELRNFWMISGVSEEEANQVLSWEVMENPTDAHRRWVYCMPTGEEFTSKPQTLLAPSPVRALGESALKSKLEERKQKWLQALRQKISTIRACISSEQSKKAKDQYEKSITSLEREAEQMTTTTTASGSETQCLGRGCCPPPLSPSLVRHPVIRPCSYKSRNMPSDPP